MPNNKMQLNTLNSFQQYLLNPLQKALNPKEDAEYKLSRLDLERYNKIMAEMVDQNPYVFVKATTTGEDAEPFHKVYAIKDFEHHSLVMSAVASSCEPDAFYKQMPFLDVVKLVLTDPVWESLTIVLNKKRTFLIAKEALAPVLPRPEATSSSL